MLAANDPYETIDWPSMRSQYSWIFPGEDPGTTQRNQIGVSFSGHRDALRREESRVREADIVPGAVFVTADEPITWLRVQEPSESLEIYPSPEAVSAAAGRTVEVLPAFGVDDPVVLAAASILRRVHTRRLHLSDLEASELSHLLIARLVERYAGVPIESRGGTRLHPRTLARIAAFMKGSLAETLTLERIAGVAAMSPFHFNRAFRRTTGLAPHKYLTMLRVERAKAILLETEKTVEQVAISVGFRNLSHFRRQFQKFTGVRPSDVRPRSF